MLTMFIHWKVFDQDHIIGDAVTGKSDDKARLESQEQLLDGTFGA